jgi:hypothetical protein
LVCGVDIAFVAWRDAEGEAAMPDRRDPISSKIEALPINIVNRNMAQANYVAAEAWVTSAARSFAWLCSSIAWTTAFWARR